MKTARALVILFISALWVTAAAEAGDKVVVIVNSANAQNLSAGDIKNIYSDQVIEWSSGKKISLYNLPVDQPARGIFSTKLLGMSAQEAAAAESNRNISNTARNPGQTKRERLVASIVSKNPGAIGYVSHSVIAGKSGVRIVITLE